MSQRDSISPRSASIGRLNQYDPLSHPLTPEPIPRYVPYTPRQRSSPVPKTTHATHGHTETTASTSRSLIDLKASAKAIGLDAGTIGLAILERLVVGSGTTSRVEDEWAEIWESVTNGKVCNSLYIVYIILKSLLYFGIVGNSDPPIRPTSLILVYYTKPGQKSRPVHDHFPASRNNDHERYKRVSVFVRLRALTRVLLPAN